jgi:hypothetical protein
MDNFMAISQMKIWNLSDVKWYSSKTSRPEMGVGEP